MGAVTVFGSPVSKKKFMKFAEGQVFGHNPAINPPMTIRGLKFRPKIVIVYAYYGGNWLTNFTIGLDGQDYAMRANGSDAVGRNGHAYDDGVNRYVQNITSVMYDDGFYIIANFESTCLYKWVAFGW